MAQFLFVTLQVSSKKVKSVRLANGLKITNVWQKFSLHGKPYL